MSCRVPLLLFVLFLSSSCSSYQNSKNINHELPHLEAMGSLNLK